MYYDGTNWVKLTYGTTGHVLTTAGVNSNPYWAAGSSGTALPSVGNLGDVLTNVANYNKYFLDWGLKHNLLETTQTRLLQVVKQLTKEEITAVQGLIQTDSHQIVTLNKTLARIKKRKTNRKYTPTVKRKELAAVKKAIKDFKKVNIGTIQENLYNKYRFLVI